MKMAKAKVMIVDDEPEIVRSLGMRLRANGYDVVSAMDGLQATNVAMKEQPDVIILDIGLPAGDGHMVAKRLRESMKTCSVPIIFLTARTSESDYERAFQQGVSKYLTKPFRAEDIIDAVSELTASNDPAA
jgi:DNA-binding response OmpR family regulator